LQAEQKGKTFVQTHHYALNEAAAISAKNLA
jgi:hypothetical protein